MKIIRILAIVVLLFSGVSSCAGGVPLILDPSGGILKMPLSLLEHSPFHSFLVPGLILFFANGVLSLVIAVAAIRKTKSAALWVAIQGCVMFGWITIEVIIMRAIVWPHFVYWGVAVVLIGCGWVLQRHQWTEEAAALAAPSAMRE